MKQSTLKRYESSDEGYKDKETLERLYYDERKSLKEIGDIFGRTQTTVADWMDRHGLERRTPAESKRIHHSRKPVSFCHDKDGYEIWRGLTTPSLRNVRVRVHRLLAVAEFGFDAVRGMDVHHGVESHLPACGIPWANWGGNLRLVAHDDHGHIHSKPVLKPSEAIAARTQFAEGGMGYQELADEYNIGYGTMYRVVNREPPYHDI